jgi:hypothetical protein
MMEMMLARSVMWGGVVGRHRCSASHFWNSAVVSRGKQQELAGGAMGLYALQ